MEATWGSSLSDASTRGETNSLLSGETGQSNYQFLASFSGRPQQPGFFFNQENTGNVSDPFGLRLRSNFFRTGRYWGPLANADDAEALRP